MHVLLIFFCNLIPCVIIIFYRSKLIHYSHKYIFWIHILKKTIFILLLKHQLYFKHKHTNFLCVNILNKSIIVYKLLRHDGSTSNAITKVVITPTNTSFERNSDILKLYKINGVYTNVQVITHWEIAEIKIYRYIQFISKIYKLQRSCYAPLTLC